jgi:hypothetical protein
VFERESQRAGVCCGGWVAISTAPGVDPSHPQPSPHKKVPRRRSPAADRRTGWTRRARLLRCTHNQAALPPMACRGVDVMAAPPGAAIARDRCDRCDRASIMASHKCGIVGKGQSVIIMRDPSISTRTRITPRVTAARVPPAHTPHAAPAPAESAAPCGGSGCLGAGARADSAVPGSSGGGPTCPTDRAAPVKWAPAPPQPHLPAAAATKRGCGSQRGGSRRR